MGAETELALSDLVVTDTKLDPEGDAGIGLRIRDGAKLALSRGFIGSNYKAGLVIQEALTDALIEDLVIRDTATRADGSWGRGLNIESGAEVTGQRVLLANNHEFGMYIGNEDTKVTLSNVTVLGTNPSASDGVGDGVRVEDGASATFDKLKVEGNAGIGFTASSGADVSIRDATLGKNYPAVDATGMGLVALGGASLSLERADIFENYLVGAVFNGDENNRFGHRRCDP